MRYLLAHPEHMKGQREIMRALTTRRGYGIEFVEQARLFRMVLFTGGLFFTALAIAIVYGARTGDWMGGFTIGCEWQPLSLYRSGGTSLTCFDRDGGWSRRSLLRAELCAPGRAAAGGCVVPDARLLRRSGGATTVSLGPPRLVSGPPSTSGPQDTLYTIVLLCTVLYWPREMVV